MENVLKYALFILYNNRPRNTVKINLEKIIYIVKKKKKKLGKNKL